MPAVVENGRTVVTPTAWKWYLGAALLAGAGLLTDGMAVLLVPAAALALTGSGLVNRIVLDTDGFEYTNYGIRKRFTWREVTDFRVQIYRVNFFAATKLITFTEVARRDTLYGKFARAVGGGTQSMSVIGIEPSKLLELISLYSAHGAHAEPQAAPEPPIRPKPVRPPVISKPAAPMPAFAKISTPHPVELVVDSRTRARQTKGWPNG